MSEPGARRRALSRPLSVGLIRLVLLVSALVLTTADDA